MEFFNNCTGKKKEEKREMLYLFRLSFCAEYSVFQSFRKIISNISVFLKLKLDVDIRWRNCLNTLEVNNRYFCCT